MDLELRHLRYFVAVAEELHFGHAAARLHIAQPPLSQQIRRLEEIAGARLLDRTSRSVALTPAGEDFLERARRVLAAARESLDAAARIHRGEAGRLEVGFVSSAITLGVPERIQAFRTAYPDVALQLSEGQTAQNVRRLVEGTIDVAVVRDAEPRDDIEIDTLATERYVAVLPLSHPRAEAKRVSAAALRRDPFVFYPRSAGELAYQRNLQPCYDAGYEPDVVQEASHWLTAFHLVAAGTGITIAPASAAETAPATVARVPLTGTTARSEVQLITRSGEDRPIVRNFTG